MRYRRLGDSPYKVSEIGMGCEHIMGKSFEVVNAVVKAALAGGVNIFDCFMAEPEIRSNLGRALEGYRDDVFLQGHIGCAWVNGQYKRTRDLPLCQEFIGDFMERTRSQRVDIAMVHFGDTVEDVQQAVDNGLYEYGRQLVREGKARLVGVSSHVPAVAEYIVERGLVDVLMLSLNPAFDFLEHGGAPGIDPVRERLYRLCESKGVGITVMKTLAGGRLLDANASPFGRALTVPQCAHYALTRPGVASVLIGATSVDYVGEMLAYETASEAERDYSPIIASGGKLAAAGRCMYCNHCHPCPAKIDVAAVTKYTDLQLQTGMALPNTISEHYAQLSAHASDCISCGACEPRCPFSVHIRENMRRAVDTFGY